MEPQWIACFTPWVRSLGHRLWTEGHVRRVHHNGDTAAILVTDDEDCLVGLSLAEDGRVQRMGCSCFYADDGSPCCHMVAALYALEEERGSPVLLPEPKDPWWQIRKVNWNPESTRRWADFGVRRRAEVYQTMDIWASRPGRRSEKVLSESILAQMESTVQSQIRRGLHLDAFQVICITLDSVLSRDVELSDFQNRCAQLWLQLKELCTPSEQDKMYQWFSTTFPRSFAVRDLLFRTSWRPEQTLFTLTSLAPVAFQKSTDLSDGPRLVTAILAMARSLDWTYEQMQSLFRRLPGWASHCSVAIMSMEGGTSTDGLLLLRLCRDTSPRAPAVIGQSRRYLSRLYQAKVITPDDLIRLFTFPTNTRNLASILREILSKNDWHNAVTKMLQDPAWKPLRLDLLMLDARYPELYDYLRRRGSLQDLNRCSPILEQWSGTRVRDLYAEAALNLGRRLETPRDCRTLMDILRKLGSYNGGEARIQDVLRALRQIESPNPLLAQVLARFSS